MQLGFSGFLKHVGYLMRLCKEQDLQKVCKVSPSTHASASSKIFSYLVGSVSNDPLSIPIGLAMLLLWGLWEP